MSRARAAIAARTTVDQLFTSAVAALGKSVADESETFDDFFDAVSYCRPLCEELGGEEGSDGWYAWQVGDWAILGDLSVSLQKDYGALEALSKDLGLVVVTGLDPSFEYAHFACYEDGAMSRRLTLEDELIDVEGIPIKVERGQQLDDFTVEEAERLWTSYGLPTFEYDPEVGTFVCRQVRAKG